MYKLIPIFLFAFGFAETVDVYYQTDTPNGLVVSGEGGNALHYEIGECWIP